MKTIVALFDVDGTLFTGHVWHGMLDYFRRTRGPWPVRAFWYAHLPSYALWKLKLISQEQFRGPWGTHLAWLARGWNADQLRGLYDYIAHEYVTPFRREDTIGLLQNHRAQGHVVVLVSTGFTDMIAAIGQTVGAHIAVGSDLEMRDGRCTGRVVGPIVIGAQKGVAAKAKLAQLGYEVDYAHSFAYADSITDMGLFDSVGNPRPVYPDAELAKVAAARGWVSTNNSESANGVNEDQG